MNHLYVRQHCQDTVLRLPFQSQSIERFLVSVIADTMIRFAILAPVLPAVTVLEMYSDEAEKMTMLIEDRGVIAGKRREGRYDPAVFGD